MKIVLLLVALSTNLYASSVLADSTVVAEETSTVESSPAVEDYSEPVPSSSESMTEDDSTWEE